MDRTFETLRPVDPAEFAGKHVVVTGASRGIGAAIVRRFIDGGATVVTTARNATDETPETATFIAGDVSTFSGVRAFAAPALDALGGVVDILVNNAGAARPHPGGISTIPDEEWLDALNLNYLSAVRVTNALLPGLREAGTGSAVVNVSSGAALRPAPPVAHYGAAKAALNAYGKALANELAPAGIRVNTIVPGNVLTPGPDELRQTIADAVGITLADTTAGTPLGRPGDPRDIAEAVAYLASDRSQWVTGVTLTVDGGELPTSSPTHSTDRRRTTLQGPGDASRPPGLVVQSAIVEHVVDRAADSRTPTIPSQRSFSVLRTTVGFCVLRTTVGFACADWLARHGLVGANLRRRHEAVVFKRCLDRAHPNFGRLHKRQSQMTNLLAGEVEGSCDGDGICGHRDRGVDGTQRAVDPWCSGWSTIWRTSEPTRWLEARMPLRPPNMRVGRNASPETC